MMVLKKPFFSCTGEDSTLHIHGSGLAGDRALSRYDSCVSQKMVLKSQYMSDTVENSVCSLLSCPGDKLVELM